MHLLGAGDHCSRTCFCPNGHDRPNRDDRWSGANSDGRPGRFGRRSMNCGDEQGLQLAAEFLVRIGFE